MEFEVKIANNPDWMNWIAFTLALISIIGVILSWLRYSRITKTWSKVEAEVVGYIEHPSRNNTKTKGPDGEYYNIDYEAKWSYNLNGTTYCSASGTRGTWNLIKIGQTIDIHVNPNQPDKPVLKATLALPIWFSAILSTTLIAWGLIGIISCAR